jgi:putative aldouronate transport system substrate-binding protein
MKDGKRTPRPEVLEGFKKDTNAYSKETGIRKWTWFIKNGNGKDGTPYDLAAKYDRDRISAHALISMKDSTWDTSLYDNLGPVGGTPDALVEQKVKDIVDKGFTTMIYSESASEAESAYNKMISNLKANKAEKIEEMYSKNYAERVNLWK